MSSPAFASDAPYGAPVMFRQFVEREAFGVGEGRRFETRGAPNAAVVTEYLFHSAQNRFRILTDNLTAEVYGRSGVQDAALAFLKRDPLARIFVLSERGIEPPPNAFRTRMREAGVTDRVIFRSLEKVSLEHNFNCAVADMASFRLEPDHDDRVLVQFRAREAARQLCDAFDKLWAMGGELSWEQIEERLQESIAERLSDRGAERSTK